MPKKLITVQNNRKTALRAQSALRNARESGGIKDAASQRLPVVSLGQ
jgi:hypothetical protein